MTTKKQFERGDIVVLKSGGPPMTVETNHPPAESNFYGVCWFPLYSSIQRDTLPEGCLERCKGTDQA